MLWEIFVLVLKILDSLNGKSHNKQSEIEMAKGKISKLEEENKNLKNQFSENSKKALKLDNSLEALEKRVTNLGIQINDKVRQLEQKMNNIFDVEIKNSLTPFLSLVGTSKPTPLSFLQDKYPFLKGRIKAQIRDKWFIKVGKNQNYRIKLLIEGEEKIRFKNPEIGETSVYFNMFYVGESNGNPLVALRRYSDNKFWCVKSKSDGTDVWKKNIESYDDLWTLKEYG